MSEPGQSMKGSATAVDSGYRTGMEILTRRGGVFWGLVLVLVGGVWFTAVVLNIPLRFDILIPLLVIIAGIYLLITKLMA